MTDEAAIRKLITHWATAVHVGDLYSVLAEHDSDIVMFDVPPPYQGLRGLDEYRDAWSPFFEWQRQGAEFEIVELDVTARARTWRSRGRCCAAVRPRSSKPSPTTDCG